MADNWPDYIASSLTHFQKNPKTQKGAALKTHGMLQFSFQQKRQKCKETKKLKDKKTNRHDLLPLTSNIWPNWLQDQTLCKANTLQQNWSWTWHIAVMENKSWWAALHRNLIRCDKSCFKILLQHLTSALIKYPWVTTSNGIFVSPNMTRRYYLKATLKRCKSL